MIRRLLLALPLLGLLGCGSADPEPGAPAADAGAPDARVATTLAEHASITEVSAFQTVKIPLLSEVEGALDPAVPVVNNKAFLLRVYVKRDTAVSALSLVARLRLVLPDGQERSFTQQKVLKGRSSDGQPSSTFGFELPAELARPGITWDVEISPSGPLSEAFPGTLRTESAPLPVAPSIPTLRVKLVPVRYEAGGTTSEPDTTEEQLTLYRDTLFRLYPTSRIEVSWGEPLLWTEKIAANGDGWDSLLGTVADLRYKGLRVTDDTFVVGVVAPGRSIDDYCRRGCVLGLAPVARERDVGLRAATIVGFSGEQATDTLAHELGHALGRLHANCGGASGIDKQFPYSEGGIHSWGYDVVTRKLIDPAAHSDFMGYCSPVWVSDYTYKALFERLTFVARTTKSSPNTPISLTPDAQVLRVRSDGSVEPAPSFRWASSITGDPVSVPVLGGAAAEGRFVKFDHAGRGRASGKGWLVVPPGLPVARIDAPALGRMLAQRP